MEYNINVIFLDDDEYEIGTLALTVNANNSDEARDKIKKEIKNNIDEYPSNYYETELIDVC